MKEQGELHPEFTKLKHRISILEESAAAIDELYLLDQLKEEMDATEYESENPEDIQQTNGNNTGTSAIKM